MFWTIIGDVWCRVDAAPYALGYAVEDQRRACGPRLEREFQVACFNLVWVGTRTVGEVKEGSPVNAWR